MIGILITLVIALMLTGVEVPAWVGWVLFVITFIFDVLNIILKKFDK